MQPEDDRMPAEGQSPSRDRTQAFESRKRAMSAGYGVVTVRRSAEGRTRAKRMGEPVRGVNRRRS